MCIRDRLEFEVALKVPEDLYLVSGLLNAEASDKSVNIHATNYIELDVYKRQIQ